MSPRTRRRTAWSVPAVTAAAVAAAALAGSGSASAADHPRLPARTAAQLLVALQHPGTDALSGTVVETARLGLPQLPDTGAAALDPQALLTGSHTAKVWLDGPQRQRLALLGTLSESDVVHSGRDVWTYTSSTRRVGHQVLPARDERTRELPGAAARLTPQGAATEVLQALDPTTVVTVDRTQRVAGRPAYTLVLQPRDTARTTVREVTLAVDARYGVPLAVAVYGAGREPAFQVGFTEVRFARPAAGVFAFQPPRGSTVSSQLVGPLGGERGDREGPLGAGPLRAHRTGRPTVLGTGWGRVAVLPAGPAGAAVGGSGGVAALVARLTTLRPDGSRLLHTALVNALLTRDGRLLVGAVPVSVLDEAAAGRLG